MASTETKSSIPAKRERTPERDLAAWHPFESLRQQMERLFDEFDGGFRSPALRMFPSDNGSFAMPAVDVVEKENAYEILAELPGMDEKNVDVEVKEDFLTITGEKREEKEEKKKGYHLQERSYGSFRRSFRLPDDVDAAKIDAAFKNGILTVTLPKKPEAVKQAQKIAVKAG